MPAIDDLIQRYLEDTATEEEQKMLRDMIRSEQYESKLKECIGDDLKAEMAIRRLMDLETQAKGEAIFNKILNGDTSTGVPAEKEDLQTEYTAAPAKRSYKVMLRYAAAVVLLVAAAGIISSRYLFPPAATPFANAPAENMVQVINNGTIIQRLTLHDGSIVALKPGSEIRYPEIFGSKREVYLSGEAFFEVAHDASHPFMVYSNEVTTKVVGTSFNVKAYEHSKEIVVSVKTGKVSVTSCTHEVTLTPNLRAVFSREEQHVTKEIVEDPYVLVQKPVLQNYYTNAQIIPILKDLGESYGVEIKYNAEALASCTLTSDVMEEEGLYEQLDIICNALGGSYRMEDAAIIIDANGCK